MQGRGVAVPFSTAALGGFGGVRQAPATLLQARGPSTHCTGSRGGGGVRKLSPATELESRTVQPIATHYTDYAIPAAQSKIYGEE
jgi:hypothetical protein